MADLALWPIGNCQVSALVDGEGGLRLGLRAAGRRRPAVLFCSPWAAPGGEWRIAVENQVSAEQSYLRNTPILTTRLTDADGGGGRDLRLLPALRAERTDVPPGRLRPDRPAARRSAEAAVALNPATDWGAREAERTSGTNHIRYLLKPQPLRLTTDAPVGQLLDGRAFRLERAQHFFLGPDEPFVGNVGHTLAAWLHQTVGRMARLGAGPRHPARMAAQRHPRRDRAQALPA
jgi:hypothetical protein